MILDWDEAKSAKLKTERGASFSELAEAILSDGLLDVLPHPQPDRHPRQEIFVVRYAGEIWSVIVERRGLTHRLATAYRSRKLRKTYGE